MRILVWALGFGSLQKVSEQPSYVVRKSPLPQFPGDRFISTREACGLQSSSVRPELLVRDPEDIGIFIALLRQDLNSWLPR